MTGLLSYHQRVYVNVKCVFVSKCALNNNINKNNRYYQNALVFLLIIIQGDNKFQVEPVSYNYDCIIWLNQFSQLFIHRIIKLWYISTNRRVSFSSIIRISIIAFEIGGLKCIKLKNIIFLRTGRSNTAEKQYFLLFVTQHLQCCQEKTKSFILSVSRTMEIPKHKF